MTLQEVEATLGENLDPKEWRQFVHRDGTLGGWFGEGAVIDPTVKMDPAAIVRGKTTAVGEFVLLGPGVVIEGGAYVKEGPEIRDGVHIDGPFFITGRRTQIIGPDVNLYWNADPEERTENNFSILTDVSVYNGSHIAGRVNLFQTEAANSTISGPHTPVGILTQAHGSHLLNGSSLEDGALAINSDFYASTAAGRGTLVRESSLTNTVAPTGQVTEGQILGPTGPAEGMPSMQPKTVLLMPSFERDGSGRRPGGTGFVRHRERHAPVAHHPPRCRHQRADRS